MAPKKTYIRILFVLCKLKMLFALFDAELGGKLRKKSICYKMIKVFQLGMILISLLIAGCTKDEAQIFTDNDAPYYDKVPSV